MFLLKIYNLKIQNCHLHMWYTLKKKTLIRTLACLGFKEMCQTNSKIMLIQDPIQEEMECFHFQIMKKISDITIWMSHNLYLKMRIPSSFWVRQISLVNFNIPKSWRFQKYFLKMKLRYWIKMLRKNTSYFWSMKLIKSLNKNLDLSKCKKRFNC